MTVISRKEGEGIIVDDTIDVTVVQIRGDEVRLAIKLPPGASIRRGEHPQLLRQAEAFHTDP